MLFCLALYNLQMDRIHKLLQAEYEELVTNESLLLESPFAETTRDGHGLREVALGLTTSKLIVASDNLADNRIYWCARDVDPSIESLELKSIYPLEYVTLKVFRQKKRKALEARLIDGRAKYYELGGLGCRARSWNDWCAHVRRLLHDPETNTRRQPCCKGWTRKHLYLGPDYEELWDKHYSPKPVALAKASLRTIKHDLISARSTKASSSRRNKQITRRVARFAEGVDENCSHPLYIQLAQSSSDNIVIHRRICPTAHFLRGYGPWSIHHGDRVSLQSRLTQSLASVRRQVPELRLPVSRRQLARATASLASLQLQVSTRSVVLFWTADYWYRPRATAELYRDVRRHLDQFHEERDQRNYHRTTTAHLRQLLKLQCHVTLCDISSTTLSRQLTLIDRELFTRISINEVRNLAEHRESRDAPNFAAWVAFAHRVTCLFESQVLRIRRVDERSRIVARSIRTAERCVEDGNFQSASSIVAALQSPAVYRHNGCSFVCLHLLIDTSYDLTFVLKATWAYLRTHHSTKYNTMAKLSKLFASTNTRHYHEAWMTVENNRRSSIPSTVDVLTRLLGLQDFQCKVDGDLKILGIRVGCSKLRNPSTNKIDQLVVWLKNCQNRAFNYNYSGDSLAWEFLLKVRYREDRENFILSFYLEPGSK